MIIKRGQAGVEGFEKAYETTDKTTKQLSGVLLIDKPQGLTSARAVERVKRWIGKTRVGHTGTLDPQATGLLVLCIGKATRLWRFMELSPKVYSGTIMLGISTDTYDMEGAVKEKCRISKELSRSELEKTANRFVGKTRQLPPPFSAVKKSGKPLYRYARKGQDVEVEPRDITVHEFNLEEFDAIEGGLARIAFTISCEGGTYVRSIANDFGNMLGCGGALESLRRISCGSMSVDDALSVGDNCKISYSEIEKRLIGCAKALSHLPEVKIDNRWESVISCGCPLEPKMSVDGEGMDEGNELLICGDDGELIAVHEVIENNPLTTRPIVVIG